MLSRAKDLHELSSLEPLELFKVPVPNLVAIAVVPRDRQNPEEQRRCVGVHKVGFLVPSTVCRKNLREFTGFSFMHIKFE